MSLLIADTDVVSFIYKGYGPLAAAYRTLLSGTLPVISFMTLAELRRGALQAKWGDKRAAHLEEYLQGFRVHYADEPLCSEWARVMSLSYRLGRPIGTADAWIAATAIRLSAPLATHNVRHFEHIPDLRLLSAL